MTDSLEGTPIAALPPLYAKWVDAMLGGPIPKETDATCDDCAMCPKEASTSTSTQFFNPDVQCCTYFPVMPNFLVGSILADPDFAQSPIHAMVRGENVKGEVVSPLGITPPKKHDLLYQSHMLGFGLDTSLRCPFHVDATPERGPGCGIWRHRQSMCCTWYCKFSRGNVGMVFWADLHHLLEKVEQALKWWAALQLGLSEAALKHLLYLQQRSAGRVAVAPPGRLDLEIDDLRRLAIWETWAGKEDEFYKKTAALVQGLTWDDILRIAGPDLEAHQRIVRKDYERLISTEIPDRLRVGSFEITQQSPERTQIVSYSKLDPLDLPTVLTQLLPFFDGRPTAEILDQIRTQANLNLSPGLIRKLVDYKILTPA